MLLQAAITTLLTITTGLVLVFIKNTFIEPVFELRELIGEISYYVFLQRAFIESRGNSCRNGNEKQKMVDEVGGKLKELSAKLRALSNKVPLTLLVLPSKPKLYEAAGQLSILSYFDFEEDVEKLSICAEKIFLNLEVEMYKSEKN